MSWCKSHFGILALVGSFVIATITRIVLPFQLVFQKGGKYYTKRRLPEGVKIFKVKE